MSVKGYSQYTVTTSGSAIWDLGAEYDYNSGHSYAENNLGIRYDGFQNRSNWNFGVALDFGHSKSGDALKVSGFGLSAGYRYGFGYATSGNGNFFGGIKTTLEFNTWKDAGGKIIFKETTFIPKIEGGYEAIFNTHGFAAPCLGYGYAINLTPAAEKKPDDGGRFIPGISVGYRF